MLPFSLSQQISGQDTPQAEPAVPDVGYCVFVY